MDPRGKAAAKVLKTEHNGEEEQERVPNVKVTVGGLRPPRLWQENPLPSQVANFCRAYKQYVERINIANEDGEQRTPASLRELVPDAVQEFVCFKWY